MRAFEFLHEAAKPKVGRTLQHAEDLVIVDGSVGALRALDQLESIANSVDDITVKWDGSPAIYFGRDEQGRFVLTDKSGFLAKGYNGKITTAPDLEKMLLSRGKVAPDDSRKQFAGNMAGLWHYYEAIVDPSFRGYLFGDLLYFTQPPKNVHAEFVFTPNTVTYEIPSASDLGKRIEKSTTGVVVHHFVNFEGETTPIKGPTQGIDTSQQVLVVGPTTVTEIPDVDIAVITDARNFVYKNAAAIDTLLDDEKLVADKMSDFKATLYKFVNQQVGVNDLKNLNAQFEKWVAGSKITKNKQAKIAELRASHPVGFAAIFTVLEQIMKIKDTIIEQMDVVSPIQSSINGQKGGEGYVKGDIKLVSREKFTAANKAKYA